MHRIFTPGSEKPYELHSLKQAAFVLRELNSGTSRGQLIRIFRGDEWTINFWIFFLAKYRWMEPLDSGGWKMTEEGESWLKMCEMTGSPEDDP